jgi:branched-chain amino acid transport system ATP-binding protein
MTHDKHSDIAIEFSNVLAGYGDFMILNNLSLQARRGKITLLLGPNGAGKSTVLKTLFGLLKVRQGRIKLDGQDITGASSNELLTQHGIAFVPQGRNLFGQLSVASRSACTARPRRSRAASKSSWRWAARCCCVRACC